jgi:hypothetical protein
VTATTVTVSYVPKAVVDDYLTNGTATFTLVAEYLPRVHNSVVGTVVPEDEPPHELNRLLLPKYYGNQWQPYNRIRDKEGVIQEGTYVAAVSGDTLTLSRSLPPGTPSQLNLYDADVRGLNTTQVF